MVSSRASEARSSRSRAAASPRRRPRSAISHHSAASRSFSTPIRNVTSCRSVQTATGGRMPSRRQASTRSSVQMTGCGRTGLSSRTWASGLLAMRPSRTAAFSADRSVARTRSTGRGLGRPPCRCESGPRQRDSTSGRSRQTLGPGASTRGTVSQCESTHDEHAGEYRRDSTWRRPRSVAQPFGRVDICSGRRRC